MIYTGTDRIDSFFLAHHGVKGQKWGVRRFQNPDGTLTSAGKARYGEGDSKQLTEDKKVSKTTKKKMSGYERMYSKAYQKQGLTKEQADEMAAKRKKVVKKVAIIAGAVTAAAVTGYVAHRVSRDFFDKTIKPGTTIQTLSKNADRMDKGDSFYTAYKKKDKTRYKGWFGQETDLLGRPISGTNKHVIKRTAKEQVKIASPRSSKKIFDSLMENDKEFASDFAKFEKSPLAFGDESKTKYDKFNRLALLDNRSDETKRMRAKFYEKARKAGYGGVLDVNDAKYSGYDATAPIIFAREKFGDQTVSKLTDEAVSNSRKKTNVRAYIDIVKSPKSVATLGVASLGIAGGAVDSQALKQAQKNKDEEADKIIRGELPEKKVASDKTQNGNPKNIITAAKKTRQIKKQRKGAK